MKRVPILVVLLLLAAAAAFGVQHLASDRATSESAEAADGESAGEVEGEAGESAEEEEEEGGPQKPADYLTLKWTSGQDVTQAMVERAKKQAKAIPQGSKDAWSLVGPSNIGARIVDLVVDPDNPDTMYTAVSGGGVWKTTDAGVTFEPVWPIEQTQAMGAIARGPDGTLWAGTGEANPSGGGITYFGDGIYKSSDGGGHWEHWGLVNSAAIGRIAVDPTDPNRVFVAAAGSISRVAGQRGIYRLDNKGKDWKLVLAPPNDTTGGIDVAIDPSNPQRVFAVLWDHKRNNGARTYGGVGSGLYRSDDGGDTWKRLENIVGPLATYDQTQTGLTSDASLGRIGVALAPSDPNRVYVAFGSPYGPDKGFYISDDGGDSFHVGGRAYASGGYQWWFGRLWVDPKDKNHLFNADVNNRESIDGGLTWRNSGSVHADQHGMEWDPNVPNRVYLGNDGGIYRSDANGAPGTWRRATFMPWNQSYHLAVAQDDPTRLATGLQDNGSVRTWTNTAPPGDLTQWNAFGGGDGHEVLIDYTNHNIYYECLQVGSCRRHEDNGVTSQTFNFGARHSSRITTDAPIILDPTNPQVIYFGGNVLDRSTNKGQTFTQISPPGDFLTGPVPPEENDLGPFYANEYATITWIAPAKTDGNTIYVGTDTGRLWKTTDLGATWTEFVGKGLPVRWVNAIVVDPTDANHVYVAFSGYREGDDSANIWETTDGGDSWENISGNLPNAPVEMITYDQPNGQLYAATDFGVFYLKNGKKNWSRLGTALPNTSVLDVKLTGDGQTLYAATFGRSVWQVSLAGAN
jgi:photosystem II stability/assembly factor-like uncharacterized protein